MSDQTKTREPAVRETPAPVRRPVARTVWEVVRKAWRRLTSMSTALALLFLLALAAIPGALLPQHDLSEANTTKYIADKGEIGVWMDRLGLFDVFASWWFTSIYVLLFVSLVGCLTPRMAEHARALRAEPVATPRNLTRMPRHEQREVDGEPAEIAERIAGNLRGWRKAVRVKGDVVEVSAEKGFLREAGNLLFHFALLGLLVALAIGKTYGYEGTRILTAGADEGLCNGSTSLYDSFRPGSRVDGTGLAPFCVRPDAFRASYHDNGQADDFAVDLDYQEGADIAANRWQRKTVKVNEPLRLAGDRVYLLGHGYSPVFTVTYPGGRLAGTFTTPFIPADQKTLQSEGVVRVDPPGGLYPDEEQRRKNQIVIQGLFAPTASYHGDKAAGGLLISTFPEARDPAVAINVLQGDSGLDTGRSQNVYQLDPELEAQGRLVRKARANLAVGESVTLPDGSTVRFDGVKEWVSLQVSHDPAQGWVLASAIAMLIGLVGSLVVKRRRVWARCTVAPGDAEGQRRTVVELAGLARTDAAGWGDGFGDLVADVLKPTRDRGRA